MIEEGEAARPGGGGGRGAQGPGVGGGGSKRTEILMATSPSCFLVSTN